MLTVNNSEYIEVFSLSPRIAEEIFGYKIHNQNMGAQKWNMRRGAGGGLTPIPPGRARGGGALLMSFLDAQKIPWCKQKQTLGDFAFKPHLKKNPSLPRLTIDSAPFPRVE